MIIEPNSLWANCSEAVVRIRTSKMGKGKAKKLLEILERAVEKYDYDTDIYETKIFGVKMIEVKGNMPYNDYKSLEAIFDKVGVNSLDVERSGDD